MILSDLPKAPRQPIDLIRVDLATGEVTPDHGLPAVLSSGAAGNIAYKGFPCDANTFRSNLELRLALQEAGTRFPSGDEDSANLMDWLRSGKAPKALTERLDKVKGAPGTVAQVLRRLEGKDNLTAMAEAVQWFSRKGTDVAWAGAASPDAEVLRTILSQIAPQGGKGKPTLFRNTSVVILYNGLDLAATTGMQDWHAATRKVTGAKGAQTCIICGESSSIPLTAQAKIKGAIPGCGVDGSAEDAMSWGLRDSEANRVCQACWQGSVVNALTAIGASTIQLGDYFLSLWDGAGGTEPAEVFNVMLDSKLGPDEAQALVARIKKKHSATAQGRPSLAEDIRIQLWAPANTTLNIYAYVSTRYSDLFDSLWNFGQRFTVSLPALVEATSPGSYQSGKWKLEPKAADWRRWLDRVVRGGPVSRMEVGRILDRQLSIFHRNLEGESKRLAHTIRSIMSDYVKDSNGNIDTKSPAYLLGSMVAVGASMASSGETGNEAKTQRSEVFRKGLVPLILARPAKGLAVLQSKVAVYRKAFHKDKEALRNLLTALPEVPQSFSDHDKCLFWIGMAATDKEIQARKAEATAKKLNSSTATGESGDSGDYTEVY
jgi:hypothetical protein